MQNKSWITGTWQFVNKLFWGKPEIKQIYDVLETDWFGNGKHTLALEKKLIEFSGHKFAQVTNSGSAAINLAIQTLIQKGIWKRGDLVLHPINTFATSISSAIMAGLVPVYVDSDEGTYVISTDGVRCALAEYPKIRGAIIPALLGNVPDLDVLRMELGERLLILDSCDVLGSMWYDKPISWYGDFAAFSFYGSHHISSFGVGGALVTSDSEYAQSVSSLTFWGRDVNNQSLTGVDNFLKRYTYETLGTDSQLSAVQAAFALAQFERLPSFIQRRKEIFAALYALFAEYTEWFILPTHDLRADVSWFCFPLVIRENAPFTRKDFVEYLIQNKVEIRPVMCGNILMQKPFRDAPHRVVRPIINAEKTERNGLFLPSPPMDAVQEECYLEILGRFLNAY